MKYLEYIIVAAMLALTSCGTTQHKTEDIGFNILDSLRAVEGLTDLETRTYKTASGAELTIYNYKNCGDGVYRLNSSNHGRLYTLRGDAQNPDAVVYQLVPFDGSREINLLYKGDELLQLDNKYESPKNPTANDIYKLERAQ